MVGAGPRSTIFVEVDRQDLPFCRSWAITQAGQQHQPCCRSRTAGSTVFVEAGAFFVPKRGTFFNHVEETSQDQQLLVEAGPRSTIPLKLAKKTYHFVEAGPKNRAGQQDQPPCRSWDKVNHFVETEPNTNHFTRARQHQPLFLSNLGQHQPFCRNCSTKIQDQPFCRKLLGQYLHNHQSTRPHSAGSHGSPLPRSSRLKTGKQVPKGVTKATSEPCPRHPVSRQSPPPPAPPRRVPPPIPPSNRGFRTTGNPPRGQSRPRETVRTLPVVRKNGRRRGRRQ